MDTPNSTTNEAVRKSGKHLTLDERGMIQALQREGKSLRAIAEAIGCAHTTVMYELQRGTPARTHSKGAPQSIPLSAAKKHMRSTEPTATSLAKSCMNVVRHSSAGQSTKSVKNIGRWMPVLDTPRPKGFTLLRTWSAPRHSITCYTPRNFPSRSSSFLKY